jgi:hypothetical protein
MLILRRYLPFLDKGLFLAPMGLRLPWQTVLPCLLKFMLGVVRVLALNMPTQQLCLPEMPEEALRLAQMGLRLLLVTVMLQQARVLMSMLGAVRGLVLDTQTLQARLRPQCLNVPLAQMAQPLPLQPTLTTLLFTRGPAAGLARDIHLRHPLLRETQGA